MYPIMNPTNVTACDARAMAEALEPKIPCLVPHPDDARLLAYHVARILKTPAHGVNGWCHAAVLQRMLPEIPRDASGELAAFAGAIDSLLHTAKCGPEDQPDLFGSAAERASVGLCAKTAGPGSTPAGLFKPEPQRFFMVESSEPQMLGSVIFVGYDPRATDSKTDPAELARCLLGAAYDTKAVPARKAARLREMSRSLAESKTA